VLLVLLVFSLHFLPTFGTARRGHGGGHGGGNGGGPGGHGRVGGGFRGEYYGGVAVGTNAHADCMLWGNGQRGGLGSIYDGLIVSPLDAKWQKSTPPDTRGRS
jgi:hypothetical protein